MNRRLTQIFVTFALLSTSWAFAQDSGGNGSGGGRGVVCRNAKHQESISLLDYQEASVDTSLHIDLGPGQTYQEKVRFVANRLRRLDPLFAQIILDELETFESNTKFIPEDAPLSLKEINDFSLDIALKKNGCHMAQMALNKTEPKMFEKRYLVVASLWAKADAVTKAGLVLHEIIYLKARELGASNSDGARRYNAVISSREISVMDAFDYIDLIADLDWDNARVTEDIESEHFSIVTQQGTYYIDANIGRSHKNQDDAAPMIIVDGTLMSDRVFEISGQKTIIPAKTRVDFGSDGQLRRIYTRVPTTLPVDGSLREIPVRSVVKFENGRVTKVDDYYDNY